MKTSLRTDSNASALIISLFVIFLIAACIAIAMNLTTATVRQTGSSRDFSELRMAADGAVDFAYGVWAKTVNSYYSPGYSDSIEYGFGNEANFPWLHLRNYD